jgi:hypothetical protein
MNHGWRRACWWALATVGAVAAVGLLVWVSAANLERADQVGGVVGAVAGVAALGVGLWQLRTSVVSAPPPVPPDSVRAEGGSNAARGSIRNSTARDTSAAGPSAPAGGPGVSASGGSNAAGGDVDGARAERG